VNRILACSRAAEQIEPNKVRVMILYNVMCKAINPVFNVVPEGGVTCWHRHQVGFVSLEERRPTALNMERAMESANYAHWVLACLLAKVKRVPNVTFVKSPWNPQWSR
jgi:hypothetical protein